MVQERTRKPAARQKAAVGSDDYGQAQVNWFASSPPELEPYRGRYVAILDKRVVASGETAVDVYDQLNRSGIAGALLAFVEAEPVDYFIG